LWVVLAGALFCAAGLLLSGRLSAAQPQSPPRRVENAAALARFFRALDSIKTEHRLEPVRIAHYGDSHTAADILTAEIRRRFQREFGDGGPGYIVARNPFSTQRRGVDSGATPGWAINGVGKGAGNDGFYGLAGLSLTTEKANERMWLRTDCNHFEVYYLKQPGGGTIDIAVDGISELDEPISLKAAAPEVGYYPYDTPVISEHRLEIRTVSPGKARILGVVAEKITPGAGVSYDVLGINGARAERMLSWNRAVLGDNIKIRKPDLIILAYGTNEVTDGDWSVESYARMFSSILKMLRQSAPDASIIVFGPPDRADVALAGSKMPLMIEAQRRAAREAGAAFWNSYDAMGGAGSMNVWAAQGLAQGDHVHLTGPGYFKLADMFYEDVARAYEESKSSASSRPRQATHP
jgi:lysophospholipase L1-like esterase